MLDAFSRATGIAAPIRKIGDANDPQYGSEPRRQGAASRGSGAVSYDAFTDVALRYMRQLRCTARHLTQIPADADDLVQDSYRLALQHYHELRNLAQCRAWLYRILRRQAATRYRRLRSGPAFAPRTDDVESAGDPTMPTVPGDPLEHVSLREIRDAIDALPSDLRLAVRLRDVEGFSYAEIARLTHCPTGTVRSRIARARAKLTIALRAHAEACGIRRSTP